MLPQSALSPDAELTEQAPPGYREAINYTTVQDSFPPPPLFPEDWLIRQSKIIIHNNIIYKTKEWVWPISVQMIRLIYYYIYI